jgi:hypothetical protein
MMALLHLEPRSPPDPRTGRKTGRVYPGHRGDAAPGLPGWQGDIVAALQQFLTATGAKIAKIRHLLCNKPP